MLDELAPLLGEKVPASVVAAIFLHDVVEDCPWINLDTIGDVFYSKDETFASEVMDLVNRLTKRDIFRYAGFFRQQLFYILSLWPQAKKRYEKEIKRAFKEQQLTMYNRGMADDVRAMLAKYCDKIHNHRTSEHIQQNKVQEWQDETMTYYWDNFTKLFKEGGKFENLEEDKKKLILELGGHAGAIKVANEWKLTTGDAVAVA